MPIQFLCVSCEHPIEIDDEWAGKSVACPFCRNTVVAPVESTYEPPSVVPAARGVLLSGAEDREINDYFIDSAFPSHSDVESVIAALEGKGVR